MMTSPLSSPTDRTILQTSSQQNTKEPALSPKPQATRDQLILNSTMAESVTYAKPVEQNTMNYETLRSLVSDILQEQGITVETANGTLNLEELSQDEATALLQPDGYFGVDQTSDRIVDFAMNMMANDPANYEKVRQGIEDGFSAAKEALGGYLPDISGQTYSAVMEKLESRTEELSNSSNEQKEKALGMEE